MSLLLKMSNFRLYYIIILALLWGILVLYLNFIAPHWWCNIVGMGGVSHVPANCIKYFIK